MSYFDAIEDIEPDEENITEQLNDIKESIRFLVETALNIVPSGIAKDRAKAYWYSHIVTSLDDDNDYMSQSMGSMQDTIEELGGE